MVLRGVVVSCLASSLAMYAVFGPAERASAAGPRSAVADTVVPLSPGERVIVEDLEGDLSLVFAPGSGLRVRTDDGRDAVVGVTRRGSGVHVAPAPRFVRRSVDVTLAVPAGVEIVVTAVDLDVRVEGLRADVEIHLLDGDIAVDGVRGALDLWTAAGEIEVAHVEGTVRAEAQSEDVHLLDLRGDVYATSGAGDLTLQDVVGTRVEAETLSGDVTFQGPLLPEGRYGFSTHSGDVVLAVPPGTGAELHLATYDGDFSSDLPVVLRERGGEGVYRLTLGTGGAAVRVEAFDGDVRLRRAPRRTSG